jgi:hypothetical protein
MYQKESLHIRNRNRKASYIREFSGVSGSCGCMLFAFIFNLALGGVSFAYCLFNIFGKTVPIFADVIAGLFLGEITVPLAIVVWIIKLCGVHTPMF